MRASITRRGPLPAVMRRLQDDKSCVVVRFGCRLGAGSAPAHLGSRRSRPPMYGRSASGIVTDPSAFWLFSRTGIKNRGVASAVLLRVWTMRGLASGSGR